MIKEYWLKKGMILIPVVIQEEAKEDFKKMMGWNEDDFKERTAVKFKTRRKAKLKRNKEGSGTKR